MNRNYQQQQDLYEIDKENTYELICKPLCERYGIDKYKDNEEFYVEKLLDLPLYFQTPVIT